MCCPLVLGWLVGLVLLWLCLLVGLGVLEGVVVVSLSRCFTFVLLSFVVLLACPLASRSLSFGLGLGLVGWSWSLGLVVWSWTLGWSWPLGLGLFCTFALLVSSFGLELVCTFVLSFGLGVLVFG